MPRINWCAVCAVAIDLVPLAAQWLVVDNGRIGWAISIGNDLAWVAFALLMLRRPSLVLTAPLFLAIHARNFFVAP
jgi:hypothetical protein